jgi:histidinol-phosphate aminotransferase
MLTPKETVQKMAPYSGPGEGRMKALRLDFNENLLGASPKVMEAMGKISREECGCYPEYADLNKALSQFLEVREECVVASNGSDEAIKTIFDTYVDKGDEVILLTPSYSMYELYAQVAGAKIIWVPYCFDDFSFPIDEILKAIRPNTRLIALANPNNPTGTLIAREDLVKIIEANPKMAVLIDEAYGPYARTTNIELVKLYSNVLVTQTFSKAHGLAGLRIGYLISQKENIEMISKILVPSYSVDCLAVAAAMAAIEDKAYMNAYVDEVIENREQFVEEIEKLGFQAIRSRANFILIHFGEWTGKVKSALAEQKILVRERSDLKGFLRFTIGTKEQMQRVLAILQSFCTKTALIFDMDGVLVDEGGSYRPCIVRTAESILAKAIDPMLVQTLKAKGGYNNDYDCTEAVLAAYGVQSKREEVVERFDAYYENFKLRETWLLDEQLLLKLKQKFRLAIFTGRPKKDALDALKRFGKEGLFEVVITDDDVKQRKPNPEGLFLALKRLGASKAVYFGDSKDDAEAARAASVQFIGVVPPGGSSENLRQIGVQTIIENINNLEELL